MTDDLDQDLRSLLAARAATVTADPAAGEAAIAERLQAGDHAIADVVPMTSRAHHARWLVAAAAAVAAVAIGAVLLRDDSGVETGPVANDPTTTTFVPTTTTLAAADDPLVATDGDAARDLAEQVASTVFLDEYVTESVEPASDGSGATAVVTMEGSADRDTLLAYVTTGPGGQTRLATLTAPGLDGNITTEQTDGELTGLDLSRVDRPAGQVVVVSLRGLRRDLSEVGRDQVQLDADGHVDVHPAWWDRASYLVIEVRTDDGLLGRAFQPTPDAV